MTPLSEKNLYLIHWKPTLIEAESIEEARHQANVMYLLLSIDHVEGCKSFKSTEELFADLDGVKQID